MEVDRMLRDHRWGMSYGGRRSGRGLAVVWVGGVQRRAAVEGLVVLTTARMDIRIAAS
jgi:hypothetical protein